MHRTRNVSSPVFPVAQPCLRSGMSVSYDASWEESHHFILPAQRTAKIECGSDQREVCKGLREGYSVPHRKLCFVPRKISETIGIPPQPLKQELGLRSSFSGNASPSQVGPRRAKRSTC